MYSLACILISVISNILTFSPSDTEWTAPGVEVEELARIDLLAYGESMYRPVNRNGSTHLACQAFFVEREDGIKWRVDIVYRDKVVMLEQDSDPVEFYPGFSDCRYAIFSPNGRYVMVGAEVGTEETPECVYTLIDLEEETSIRFQRTFSRAKEPVFWVSTDGSVAMLAHARRWGGTVTSDIAEAPDTLLLYNADLIQVGYHVTPVSTPHVRRSDDGKTMVLMEWGGELIGLDSTGSELWRRHDSSYDGEDSQFYGIRLSGDGSLYLISRRSGVHACDARTGDYLYSVEGFELNSSLSVSYEGLHWAAVYQQPYGVDAFDYIDVEYLMTWNDYANSRSISEINFDGRISIKAGFGQIRNVFDNGTKCISNPASPGSDFRYFYLLSAEDKLIWQTPIGLEAEIEFSGNLSPRWWQDGEPNASCLVSDGVYSVAYMDGNEVIVSKISITQ